MEYVYIYIIIVIIITIIIIIVIIIIIIIISIIIITIIIIIVVIIIIYMINAYGIMIVPIDGVRIGNISGTASSCRRRGRNRSSARGRRASGFWQLT